MVEWILCWVMLIIGIVEHNPMYCIASGVYAIAVRMQLAHERNDKN